MNEALPRWRLDTIYPGTDAPAFGRDRARLAAALGELEASMDAAGVRAGGAAGSAPDVVGSVLDEVLNRLEDILQVFTRLRVYLSSIVSVDAFDDAAQAGLSALDPHAATVEVLIGRMSAYLAGVDLESVMRASPSLRDYAYLLGRSQEEARHLMGEEAEALAAALDASGGTAWGRLHGDLIGRSTVSASLGEDAAPGEYGLAQLRLEQADPREEVRRAAFDAEVELLTDHATPFAAAMNGIKGQVLELSRRRSWPTPLDATLFDNAIDRTSLDAMQEACRAQLPVFRRYLKAKARHLGKSALAWYDLFAPVGDARQPTFTWGEAKAFVIDHFGGFSERLAAFASRAFEEEWIDAPARKGKRNGAFCTPVYALRESRVMLNFGGGLDDVFTLAHELGHAYHNDCMYRFGRGVLRSATPMTLAETASIFCETLVLGALLREASAEDRLAILEQDLRSATQLVVDIRTRFEFESAVFARRAERSLAPVELDEIMEGAQRDAYGDGLAEDGYHPRMWAHKPHYYSSGRSFYNYPYTFGYLFGLGLYNVYLSDPDAFVPRYDELLANTGMADAADLAASVGIDIRDPAFWSGGLSAAAALVNEYESLSERVSP